MSQGPENLSFAGASGEPLAARLERPVGPVSAYAVFAHCFTCGKNVRAASSIAKALAEEGVAVLRFDFTGLGSSEGDFANTTFSSNVADILAAARYVEATHGPVGLLIGHSLGGAAVLCAAARLEGVVGVATIGAPSDERHVERLITDELEAIERDGEALVTIAGRSFRIKREFLDDLREARVGAAVASLGCPLLVLHSPADAVVPIACGLRIFEKAKHPKSFVSLAGADHLLSRREDATYAAQIISAWIMRILEQRATGPH